MLKSITRIDKVRCLTAIFWLGFVMSISFMEAPLKFSILSLTEGLSLGRLVFSTLNLCEWGFMSLIGITLLLGPISRFTGLMVIIVCVLLLLQTLWFLPRLDMRAVMIIKKGDELAPSALHWGYVAVEVIKMLSLFIIGWFGLTVQPGAGHSRRYL
ncbi:hypothetical protein [Pedobacter steynii]